MLAPGVRLGRYELVAPLGAGGMGEVWRARDATLMREVAVKVLPDALAKDPAALARFEREARAVAALSHPGIVSIFDVGREGEVSFAVMELLDGDTLRARLTGVPLPERKAIEIARDVASALAAAHEKGIVHRDLKPENVFVTRDGRVKLLDFGLAAAPAHACGEDSQSPTAAHATDPGTVLGTVGYMAPEQVRGMSADPRADIFALGVMLYEMLTGRRAFRAASPVETMSAILHDDPLARAEGGLAGSPPLERLLRRCLEKDRGERFGSARDLAFALEALAGAPPTASPPAAERKRSVAVLPFRALSRDAETEHLGLGLADATITELALLRSLVARPTSAILKYENQPVDPRQAGRELGVDAVVDGAFQRAGSRVRVTVQLVDVSEGRSLWGKKIDAALDDVFQMQDEVSRKVAEALEVELTPSDERRLVRAARPAGLAHELWVKGRVHLLRDTIEDVNAAIDLFEKARDADPGLAVAWASLADSYVRLAFSFDPKGDWYPRAEEACARALALDPSLPEARYVKARIAWSPHGGFQHATAIRELAAVLDESPSMIGAYQRLSIVLLHTSMLDEGRRSIEEALAIDPADEISGEHLGFAAYLDTRFEEAARITGRSVERMPSPWAYHDVALALLQTGRSDRALEVSESASRRFPGDGLLHAARGLIAARRGDEARARQQLEIVTQHPNSFGHYHHTQHEVACIHALLGEADEAMRWLTDAARNGFPCHAFFERDPLLASLRPDPRFGALMTELRAECDGYRALYAEVRGARSGGASRPS